MQQAPGLALFLLALIDATSIGTLIIPIWLLLRRNYRAAIPRVIAYLGLIAGFYWLVGLAIRSGWNLGAGLLPEGFFQHPTTRLLMMLLGAGMIIWALTYQTDAQKAAKARKAHAGNGPEPAAGTGETGPELRVPGNLQGALGRAMDSKAGLVALALVAGLLELPTMLPYLGAMALLHNVGWSTPAQILVLALYCLVMILPALLLVLVRSLAGDRLDAWLQRIGSKLSGYAQETLGWVVGIAGYLIIRAALAGGTFGELFDFEIAF
ncbi:GAP family protein [Glutamicibacter arilaitensis]|uniref:GAP family protein n=1 Tax=Glutamicibacter arilaitensis TaxID=256701 RepID=UPI00384E6AAD